MELREKIEKYVPYNEQEEKDKNTILKYMDTFEDTLTRNNEFGHFTASAHGHGLVDMLMERVICYLLL